MVLYEQNSQVLGVRTAYFADEGEDEESEGVAQKAAKCVVGIAKEYSNNKIAKDLVLFLGRRNQNHFFLKQNFKTKKEDVLSCLYPCPPLYPPMFRFI